MIFSPLSSTAGERKERVEMAVRLKGGSIQPLSKRMARYRVPGVSMAVMNDYQIEWASGYGVRKQGTSDPVDTETLFQACSISKAVTAIAVLRLVSEGRLDLDNDVNSYLRSWKVPRNGSWQPTVTIRELLSHTGGISVPWFAGYHRQQDIPTLRQVLDGAQPSNTPEIRVTTTPGTRFRYSGGGFCILQQLLIDVMKQPFPELMSDLLLEPLGMEHSTFEQPLPAELERVAAAGHRENGRPVAGDWYVYPEMAAAGLWTTPTDLARLGLELQGALAGKSHQLLSASVMKELLTPHCYAGERGNVGLSIFLQGAGPDGRFGHAGDNTGFTSLWISLREHGRGCVLMTNSDNGWPLQEELLRTIEQVYAWPDVPPGGARSPREESRSTLELTSDEMRGMGYKVVDMLVEHFEHIREQPSEQGMNFDALLQQVREEIARGFHLAEYAETLLRDSQNWEVICPAQMGIITFRYTREGVSNAQLDALNVGLVDAMIADGYAMFSTAVLRERTVLRFCTINPRTTEQDIAEALRRLERYASKGQPA